MLLALLNLEAYYCLHWGYALSLSSLVVFTFIIYLLRNCTGAIYSLQHPKTASIKIILVSYARYSVRLYAPDYFRSSKLFHSSLEVTRMATVNCLKKSEQAMRACLNDCLLTNMFQGSDIIFLTASILCTVKSRNQYTFIIV